MYEGYCCNGTDRETLNRIMAFQDEQNPGATSNSFRLQACFLDVEKKGLAVDYFMHDFDIVRAEKPSDYTYPKEPSLCQIWAADIPSASSSFWLSFGPSEENFMSRQEMKFSKLRERSPRYPRPTPLDQNPVVQDPILLPLKSISSITFIKFTVFGKHCECNAQKCTHLKRLPPLASPLLLLNHCVLTQHEGQKKMSKAHDRTVAMPCVVTA